MKQIEQNYRTGRMRVVDVPAPLRDPGAALVRSRVSLISAGTERQIVGLAKASLAGKAIARPDLVRQLIRKARTEGLVQTARKVITKLETPIPLGYSLAGEVVEAGVDCGFRAGDRVVCSGAGVANHAEFNSVPRNLMAPVPSNVSDEAASFATVGAIALQGVRVADPKIGERVVVIGLGLIGLLTVQILKANGCKVLGFDPDPERSSLGRKLGADEATSANLAETADHFTRGRGADAVIVTASATSSEPINQAAAISRLKGRVAVVGAVGMNLDRDLFYKRELELRLAMSTGPGRYDADYEKRGRDYPFAYVRWTEQRNLQAFLELVAAGSVTPERLITHRFPIDRALNAYRALEEERALAILLTYEDTAAPARAVTIGRREKPSGDGIAFIGLGNYAKSVLLPALKRLPGTRLSTIVTATGLSAVGSAETFGFARAATDPEDVFVDETISTVFIATRHDSHAELARRALQSGKHVFVEKPLALTHEELDAVLKAAGNSRGVLTVGFNRRFAPMVEEAARMLASAPGPKQMTYRVNAGPAAPDSWVLGPEGGGRIRGEVCHFVDTLSALCGADPVEWCGCAAAGDSLAASLRFADGSVGTILYSTMGAPGLAKERIEALGADVAVVIDDFRELTTWRGSRRSFRRSSQDKGQQALVRAFMQARESAEPPIALDTIEAVSRATIGLAT